MEGLDAEIQGVSFDVLLAQLLRMLKVIGQVGMQKKMSQGIAREHETSSLQHRKHISL